MGVRTRTGSIGIGFRRGWSEWQKDIKAIIDFAKAQDFNCIDLGRNGDEDAAAVLDSGLEIGSVDLKEWGEMIHTDSEVRKKSIESNSAYVEACSKHGIRNFFLVMIPADASAGYEKNCEWMLDSFSQLVPVLEAHKARLVIEGYPARGCPVVAPESYRSFFAATDSDSIGINYDPSHLIRMGIDPIRFAREFIERIYHIHGKDTEMFAENIYEAGYEHAAVGLSGHGFGSTSWRYTIPGHDQMRWVELFKILEANGFKGNISIELEDENFNGSEAGEKAGLIHSRNFLESC
jgi:sugar phosphate isomerase/epimerase